MKEIMANKIKISNVKLMSAHEGLKYFIWMDGQKLKIIP